MPASASWAAISRPRLSRPERVQLRPSTSVALFSSMRRPTMCTVSLAQVMEISKPETNCMPSSAAAARAAGMPRTSSWSVSAHALTPPWRAACATTAGASTTSDTFEWQCKSTFNIRNQPLHQRDSNGTKRNKTKCPLYALACGLSFAQLWTCIKPMPSSQEVFDHACQHFGLVVMQHVAGVGQHFAAHVLQMTEATVDFDARLRFRPHPLPHIGIVGLDPQYRRGDLAPARQHLLDAVQQRAGLLVHRVAEDFPVARVVLRRPVLGQEGGAFVAQARIGLLQPRRDGRQRRIGAHHWRRLQLVQPLGVARRLLLR